MERYNKSKESTHFAKLKASGRFAVYAFCIYLATTFTIGYLGLIMESFLLTLPLAMFISNPIAWILMGIVLAATYKMVIEPLFYLVKGCVDEKGTIKEEKSPKEQKFTVSKSLDSGLDTISRQTNDSDKRVSINSYSSSTDSDIAPESEPDSSNNSRRNSNSSGDSGLGGKEFHGDLQTLMHQTNLKKYNYLLRQHDIAHIARVKYQYSESSKDNVFFFIPGDVNSLNEKLKEYKNEVKGKNSKKIFTAVINIGNYHWVTLVGRYESKNKQFIAYYCDSFGTQLPNKIDGKIKGDISLANEITTECMEPLDNELVGLIREKENNPDNVILKEKKDDVQETLNCAREHKNKLVSKQIDENYIVGILQETLEIGNDDNIRSSPTRQQEDGYNCGVFALENAHTITKMFKEDESFDEIDRELSKYKPIPKQLRKKRIDFTEVLMKDEEWKKAIAEGGILHDALQQINLEDSEKEKTQPATSSFVQDIMITSYNHVKNAFFSN
ncbi:ulp1 protease family, C-terminal catalytic domain protein [Wolbachia endosymbiont of Trichogramma pretiosum]|nr:ulp1 protease family, C-terminal catalytic domain protein [Wolbachia endosymbiont of Trichogramma pretiosum]